MISRTTIRPLSAEIRRHLQRVRKPSQYRKFRVELNACYRNAQLLTLLDSTGRTKYVEGRWGPLWIHHAWNTVDGFIVDLTAEKMLNNKLLSTEKYHGHVYTGTSEFTRTEISNAVRQTSQHASLENESEMFSTNSHTRLRSADGITETSSENPVSDFKESRRA